MNQQSISTFSLLTLATIGLPFTAQAQVIDTGDSLIREQNAFLIETGDRTNTSNIPLPTVLPTDLKEKRALHVSETLLAPNSVNVTANDAYIVDTVQQATGYSVTDYIVDLDVQIDRVPGAHSYAEGIELTGGNGTTQSAYIRGSKVRTDSQGNQLADSEQLSTSFSRGENARIGFRNIRENGGQIEQSGVHFMNDGSIITEDLQNGGDLDFNDGKYLTNLSGSAVAQIENVESVQQTEVSTEEAESGSRSAIDLLGFMNEEGEYTDSTRFYAESDGTVGLTHQFAPLFNNSRPTLLNIGVRTDFNSVTASVGVNQFITQTHRTETSEELSDYIVLYSTEEQTGNGDAAYDNLGGVLVKYVDGSFEFLTQWTVDSRYEQDTYFLASEVSSFTSVLIPEQEGTENLQAGLSYPVEYNNGVASIGDIVLISQDVQPENFSPITDTLSGVEDTVQGQNHIVENYNGIQYADTVDYNDAFVSLEYDRPLETVETLIPNRFGIYIGASAEVGLGNEKKTTIVTQTNVTTNGQAYLTIDSQGYIVIDGIETTETVNSYVVSNHTGTNVSLTNPSYDVALGAAYNYDKHPWTDTAGQVRAEVYTGTESGVRAELQDRIFGLPLTARLNKEFGGDTEAIGGAFWSF